MGLREARGRLVLQGGERDVRVIPPAEPLGPRLDEGADKRPVLAKGRATGRRVLLELDGQVGSLLELRTEVEERTQAEGAQRTQKMRCPGSRGGHAGVTRWRSPFLPGRPGTSTPSEPGRPAAGTG